jgi:hypothetical protein
VMLSQYAFHAELYCLYDMSLAIGRLSCSVRACLPLTNAKFSGV